MTSRLDRIAAHPLHRQLGITDVRSADGHGAFAITVDEHSLNPAGMLHGGVLYLLCDVCAYVGLVSQLDNATEAVTHDLHVSVMRPARRGDRLDLRSHVVRLGRRIAFIDVAACVAAQSIATARVTKTLLMSD